jgi:hypothetical protein
MADLPLRPRGAARRAALDAVLAEVTAADTASVGARPATTGARAFPTRRALRDRGSSVQPTGAHPRRRDLRARPGRRTDVLLGAARERGFRVVGAARRAIVPGRMLPVTATVLTTCFLVTVAAPQEALASTQPGSMATTVVYDGQDFTVPTGVSVDAARDGFSAEAAPAPTVARGVTGAAMPAGDTDVAAVRPVDGTIPTAGGFGGRQVAGCGACSTNHHGLDFAAPTGTPIVAAMAGTVVHAGWEGGYGQSVVLQHPNGVLTRYGHMSAIAVAVGQQLPAGGRVGSVGSTGVSTGSHLHFEVIVGGMPVDPAAWLAARGLL